MTTPTGYTPVPTVFEANCGGPGDAAYDCIEIDASVLGQQESAYWRISLISPHAELTLAPLYGKLRRDDPQSGLIAVRHQPRSAQSGVVRISASFHILGREYQFTVQSGQKQKQQPRKPALPQPTSARVQSRQRSALSKASQRSSKGVIPSAFTDDPKEEPETEPIFINSDLCIADQLALMPPGQLLFSGKLQMLYPCLGIDIDQAGRPVDTPDTELIAQLGANLNADIPAKAPTVSLFATPETLAAEADERRRTALQTAYEIYSTK